MGKGNPQTGTYEIRSIVDENYVVVKSWTKSKCRYTYEIKHISFFEIFEKHIKWKISK